MRDFLVVAQLKGFPFNSNLSGSVSLASPPRRKPKKTVEHLLCVRHRAFNVHTKGLRHLLPQELLHHLGRIGGDRRARMRR